MADHAEQNVDCDPLSLLPTAFAAIYEFKHGRTITIHATREQAEAARQAVAFQFWPDIFPDETPPADLKEMADRYFAYMTEHRDEFFCIEECPVEGTPVLPLGSNPLHDVRIGIEHLKSARDAFKSAGAVKTLERVRLALTSAGGAERHARVRP